MTNENRLNDLSSNVRQYCENKSISWNLEEKKISFLVYCGQEIAKYNSGEKTDLYGLIESKKKKNGSLFWHFS